MSNYQIAVNVSQTHETYYTAYKCVRKKDYHVIQNQNHPDLQEVHSPKTKNCIKAYKQPCWNGEACRQVIYLYQKLKHCRKLQNQWPRHKNNLLKGRNMLKNLSSANLQKPCKISSPQLGKCRKLPLISRDSKNTEWKSFLKSYRNCALKKHVLIALEVLQGNNVEPVIFSVTMREVLSKGRDKFWNTLIVRPANCGKEYLLPPLQKIFNTFSNLVNDKYAWLEAEKVEIIFLNDFRLSQEMIAWKEPLILPGGKVVHLPSPTNHYSNDICIDKDTFIVATSKSEIT